MANRRGTNVAIEDRPFRPAMPEGLLPVAYAEGQGAAATARALDGLSDRAGTFADEVARAEGKRAGQAAGQADQFQPLRAATLYGKAYDEAGVAAFGDRLEVRFQGHAMALLQRPELRDNPEAFRAEYDALSQRYLAEAPVEVRAWFQPRVNRLQTTLGQGVFDAAEQNRVDRGRANLREGLAASATTRAQLLALNPDDPELLRQYDANVRAAEGRIDEARQRGDIGEDEAARQRIALRSGQWTGLLQARADRIQDPAQLERFRADARAGFAAGRFGGLTGDDFATFDAALVRQGQALRVAQERRVKEVEARANDWLERTVNGQTPPGEELAAIEAEARAGGARAVLAVQGARQRAALWNAMVGLPPEERERRLRELEGAARQAAAPGVSNLPMGMRVNNPGNIKWIPNAPTRFPGAVRPSEHTDQGDPQIVFESPEAGMRAMFELLKRKYDAGQTTPEAMIARAGTGWTPGNTAAAANVARMAGLRPDQDINLNNPDAAARFMRALILQEHGQAGNRYSDDMIRAAVAGPAAPGQRPPPGARGTLNAPTAETLTWLRQRDEADRKALDADMLGFAQSRNLLRGQPMTELDFASPDLAAQMAARVRQVDSVAPQLGRPNPSYLRPGDQARLRDVVDAGGERALATVENLIRGAGPRATAVLREVGGDAPALAHAVAASANSGDRSFAQGVARALEARRVPGAKPMRATDDDITTAERAVVGEALRGRASERELTRAAVATWFEAEAQRRGVDPKNDPASARAILEDGFRRALGGTTRDGVAFGGTTRYRPPTWWSGAEQVQVPPEVRADRFDRVLGAITDADLAAMPSPPVRANGQPMTAADLRRYMPMAGPGGYRFIERDREGGIGSAVRGRDGNPFTLDLPALMPTLRARVPDAFR